MPVIWKWNRRGLAEIQDQVSRGLITAGEAIVPLARANLAPHRETGAAAESIHVVDRHAYEPKPAVFVAGASGDTFFIHEGTVDTAPIPFLVQALDRIRRQIPNMIRLEGATGLRFRTRRRTGLLSSLNRQFRDEFGTRRE